MNFEFTVEDVLSIVGRGTVAAGYRHNGVLNTGEKVVIEQKGRPNIITEVTGIERFMHAFDCHENCACNHNAGLLLRGVAKEDVEPGAMIYRYSEWVKEEETQDGS